MKTFNTRIFAMAPSKGNSIAWFAIFNITIFIAVYLTFTEVFNPAAAYAFMLLINGPIIMFLLKKHRVINPAAMGQVSFKKDAIWINDTRYPLAEVRDLKIHVDGFRRQVINESGAYYFSRGVSNTIRFNGNGINMAYQFALPSKEDMNTLMDIVMSSPYSDKIDFSQRITTQQIIAPAIRPQVQAA